MDPPPLPPGGLAIAPTTYVSYYRHCQDVLQGDYGTWAAAYAVSNANTPASVRETMLNTSELVPKVFMMLVPGPNGTPVIKTLFRPQLYQGIPGVNTPWDSLIYAFATDLGPGNQITSVQFPADAFYLTNEVRAPDVASMAAAWEANPQAEFLGPFDPDAANTVLIRSRHFMIVPQAYVPLILGSTLTPREAYRRLSTAIIADNRVVACAPVLEWLIAASTLLPAVNGQPPQSSVLHQAPVVPVPDHALATHRWNIVLADMPQLANATRTQDQAMMHAIAALQQSNAQQAAAAQLDRAAAKAAKLPDDRFPATVHLLLKVTGAPNQMQLPRFWHDIANCLKAETRNTLAESVRETCALPGAATTNPFTVTKEILDAFVGLKLYTDFANNLEQGLQLFRFAPGPAEHDRETHVRNDLFDQVNSGTATPSITDIKQLASPKVFIPSDHYQLTTALQHHSIALDVYLGPDHIFCTFYRNWIRVGWTAQQKDVREFIDEYYHDLPATAYAKFARWISLRINVYLKQLSNLGIATALPDLNEFGTLIAHRHDSFPTLPASYLQTVRTPIPARPLPAQPLPSRLPSSVPPPTANPDRVVNVRPNQAITTAFEALNLKVRRCYDIVEPVTGQFGLICVAWHATHQCFTGCKKHRSHRMMSDADKTIILQYFKDVKAANSAAA
jgi:hypothetical protein